MNKYAMLYQHVIIDRKLAATQLANKIGITIDCSHSSSEVCVNCYQHKDGTR